MTKTNNKVVHDGKWSRVVSAGGNLLMYQSKFQTGEAHSAPEELSVEWRSWGNVQKYDFAKAFVLKEEFGHDDKRILSFLIDHGDEMIWQAIAMPVARQLERDHALRFLTMRLESSGEPKSNYLQALKTLGDSRATPQLRELYAKWSVSIPSSTHEFARQLLCDFLWCCSALLALEKEDEFRQEIVNYLDHCDEVVRNTAQMALQP